MRTRTATTSVGVEVGLLRETAAVRAARGGRTTATDRFTAHSSTMAAAGPIAACVR